MFYKPVIGALGLAIVALTAMEASARICQTVTYTAVGKRECWRTSSGEVCRNVYVTKTRTVCAAEQPKIRRNIGTPKAGFRR